MRSTLQPMATMLGDAKPSRRESAWRPFGHAIALWVPRWFVSDAGIALKSFVDDVNDKVRERGYVMYCGQLLTSPILEELEAGVIPWNWDDNFMGKRWTRPISAGGLEVQADPGSWEQQRPVSPKRPWAEEQRQRFGLENPYQMSEEALSYTWCEVLAFRNEPWLEADERIAALIDGRKDNRCFYCSCHGAHVVLTTKNRVICMSCGALHRVLRDAVPLSPAHLFSGDEWCEVFAEDSTRQDEEIRLSVIEFHDIDGADAIWNSEYWESSRHEFLFYVRSSPDTIAELTRGTEKDGAVFREAGLSPVATSPPPAVQVADDAVDVDLVTNAAISLRDGVASFLSARKDSSALVTALPQLFRSVELLLKARLHKHNVTALNNHPNNPTVLSRLATANVTITQGEIETITKLRRLRNSLQHGSATFNHRRGLAVSRQTVIFLTRFCLEELDLWIGDALPPDDWFALLQIPEIAVVAEAVLAGRLSEVRRSPMASIANCPRCQKDALVRPHPRTGADCIFCGHIVVVDPEAPDPEWVKEGGYTVGPVSAYDADQFLRRVDKLKANKRHIAECSICARSELVRFQLAVQDAIVNGR